MLEYFFKVFERTLNNCAFYFHEHCWVQLINEVGVLRGISYCISDDILIIADFLGDSYYKDFLFYCAVGDYFKKNFQDIIGYDDFNDNDDFVVNDLLLIRFNIEKEES